MPRKRKQENNAPEEQPAPPAEGGQMQLEGEDGDTLVLVNKDNGDTLMLNMQSGEGIFLQRGAMAEIVVDDSDEVMDEDVDLDFGRRELDDDGSGGWAMPDVVGWLEERLLPSEAARHSRNLRRELLMAARSLLDAALRGMERSDVEDYTPPEDERDSGVNLARRRPNLRGATPLKRGPQRIELD